MKPKHQRLVFVAASVIFLCVAALLAMQAFRENLIFFYSPSDLASKPPGSGQLIRIGGLVEEGSIETGKDGELRFNVTDNARSVGVSYKGMVPALFRAGQGVVIEGRFDGKAFTATRLLTKHDENYMPREVVDALKESGRWQEGGKPAP